MAARRKNGTSKRVATEAAQILRDRRYSKKARSVAGSDLAQRRHRRNGRRK
jgi:hypothetical protein